MSDKIYKLVLLGKIADGHDIDITHEKLALVFDIDLKQIPKLLKKPTVIRKELTYDVADRYKTGLEKIGVLCEIRPPLETDSEQLTPVSEDVPELTEKIPEDEKEDKVEEIIEFAPTDMKLDDTLRVVDVKMSFGAILLLCVKIMLASIPAMIILGGIVFLLYQAIIMISSFI
ncbi:hypothetical protein QUF50_01515 [Thiotrichales bacterium HSG1]|nr:hypothetical protein [Thiotrichales bacterium HSG1]